LGDGRSRAWVEGPRIELIDLAPHPGGRFETLERY
jgi:hypothetical protein